MILIPNLHEILPLISPQIEGIEKRNQETINRLKSELKEAKETLFKERTENLSAKNEEIRTLKDQVRRNRDN